MPNDTRYLEKHGQQWRVSIAVPAALQQAFGKKNLKHPLATDSLELANEWKGEHVTRFKRMIRDARNGKSPDKYKVDPMIVEALQLRSEMDEEADALQFGDLDHLQRVRPITPDWINHSAEEIEKTEGWRRAAQFKAIATGEATPVLSMVDNFLAEQPFKPRQKRDYRRAVEKFDAWCNRKRLTAAIEETDLKVAGRYVSEEFAAKRIPFKTANKDISALSSYWRWLAKKGFTTKSANPWPDQLFPKPKAHLTGETESFKRPFTDEEVERLLTGNCTPLMHDAMWIAALSGMRVDEIARLTVSGSTNGILRVTKGKTRGAIRGVPTHPLLTAIIKRRAECKNASDFLFHELSAPEEDSAIEHSQKVVKQFVVYRRKIKVDDRRAGHRQSRIDFHSFRRWFVTKAERARIYPNVISAVVGHGKGREGMTLSVYSGGPDPETQMRECVDAVLPPAGLVPRLMAVEREQPKLRIKPLNRRKVGRPRKAGKVADNAP